MSISISKRTVDAAKAGPRDRFLWDRGIKGFGIKITPAGRKVYVVQYRLNGRSRRYTVGVHGAPWTPERARKEAKRLLGEVADGNDPVTEKITGRNSATVKELCDRYLEEWVGIHNKPSTAKEFRRIVEKQIKPALGAMKAVAVTRQDVMRLHHNLRRTPREANHTLSVLSKMFNLAEAWGIRPDGSNPARLVKRQPENKRERFLSDAELAKLGEALDEAEREGSAHPSAIAAVRLLALTGCRLGEVLGLKWEYVDSKRSLLLLPDTKTGAREHPIGAPALAVLNEIAPIEGSPWVLNGVKEGQHISTTGVEKTWARLRKKAELENARLHDLRHTIGTYSSQAGANAFLVRDKLGHTTVAMASRYVSRDADPLRILNDTVEARVDAAMKGKKGADVISLDTAS